MNGCPNGLEAQPTCTGPETTKSRRFVTPLSCSERTKSWRTPARYVSLPRPRFALFLVEWKTARQPTRFFDDALHFAMDSYQKSCHQTLDTCSKLNAAKILARRPQALCVFWLKGRKSSLIRYAKLAMFLLAPGMHFVAGRSRVYVDAEHSRGDVLCCCCGTDSGGVSTCCDGVLRLGEIPCGGRRCVHGFLCRVSAHGCRVGRRLREKECGIR